MVETVNETDIALYADFDNRFVRDDRRFGVARAAVAELPVIDISPFVEEGSEAEKARVAAGLRAACIDIGFFYLTGHGIAQSELDEAITRAHDFFRMPLGEKMKLHKNNSPTRQGYMQSGGTDPDANPDKAADLREVFGVTREPRPGEPEKDRFSVGHTQWPDPEILPGYREFMEAHVAKRVTLAQQVVRAFALSLDLPESYFDEMHEYLGCSFTFNCYPARKPADLERNQWGISPHSDYGSITLLSQDSVGGLEVRNAAGDWIDVPPLAGSLVVNVGDLFAIWTNDLYAPSLHRATNVSGKARISAPFFVFPAGATEIRCLETCQGPDNPPRYAPTTSMKHVKMLIDQSYRSGRPGLTRRTAQRFKTG